MMSGGQYLVIIFAAVLFIQCAPVDTPVTIGDAAMVVSFKAKDVNTATFVNGAQEGLKHDIKIAKGSGQSDDPYLCIVSVTNSGDQAWEGVVRVELESNAADGRFIMPGYLYGTNQGEAPYNPNLTKQFPRLRKGKVDMPYSPYWFARSDQLTHPVAMMLAGGQMLGISASPYMTGENNQPFWKPNSGASFSEYNGFSCSIEDKATVGYTIGYIDAPVNYIRPHEYDEFDGAGQGVIRLDAGMVMTFPVKVYAFAASHEMASADIIKDVYAEYHEQPRQGNDDITALKDITTAVYNDAYNKEINTYSLISKQPVTGEAEVLEGSQLKYALMNKDDDEFTYFNEGLIAWTNGTVIAVPLLEASYRLKNDLYRQQAVAVIQDIVDHSTNPANGIPFCTKANGQWSNKGWWKEWVISEGKEPTHSSYIIGQALHYIMKACQVEKELGGVSHDDWLTFVKNALYVLAPTANEHGAFPRFWSEDGVEGSEYDAFSGCWLAAAMALYGAETGDEHMLAIAKKAEAYYFSDVQKMECIKTPLDVADAPDSEGVLAYIRLATILHKHTGKDIYLERLKAGLDYELSYKFCYNVPITSAPLNQSGWGASGGSITSVCNAVIHCMSNNVLSEFRYYIDQTDDPYYQSRFEDTYNWGLQTYNRQANEFSFGKKGWSTEYFCQANRYVLDIRLVDNSRSNVWFAYHPWATASILEGINSELARADGK